MLIEKTSLMEGWERFRGFDHWPEVKVVITDRKSRYMPSRYGGLSRFFTSIEIDYRVSDGMLHSKTIHFLLFGNCSLDDLDVGNEFYVRYCPDNPSKIYVRESTQDKIEFVAGCAIIAFTLWLYNRYR